MDISRVLILLLLDNPHRRNLSFSEQVLSNNQVQQGSLNTLKRQDKSIRIQCEELQQIDLLWFFSCFTEFDYIDSALDIGSWLKTAATWTGCLRQTFVAHIDLKKFQHFFFPEKIFNLSTETRWYDQKAIENRLKQNQHELERISDEILYTWVDQRHWQSDNRSITSRDVIGYSTT